MMGAFQTFKNIRLRRNRESGYTLLELILSLALTVVIMSIIATGIRLYLVTMAKQQAAIERRLVARAVLAMVQNDLRAAMQYKDNDYSGLNDLLKTQQAIAGGPPAPAEEAEEEEDPVYDEEVVSYRPTLIGNSNGLMVDVSRLPRLDEYNPLMPTSLDDVRTPSDVKSVAYFVDRQSGGIEDELEFAAPRAPGGLFRREIDRAVASYRGDVGLATTPDKYTQLIASEIAEIRFRYFDGDDWQTDWNSVDDTGFPLAVEVVLVVDPARALETAGYQYNGFDRDNMEQYSLVVHLPLAEIIPESAP
jgi:type II secretory pathway pseudopilin PulG